jgi:hypothetical protein
MPTTWRPADGHARAVQRMTRGAREQLCAGRQRSGDLEGVTQRALERLAAPASEDQLRPVLE